MEHRQFVEPNGTWHLAEMISALASEKYVLLCGFTGQCKVFDPHFSKQIGFFSGKAKRCIDCGDIYEKRQRRRREAGRR